MSPVALRKGWCPGALRPMPAGDGLLVRLRLTAGELPVATARAIAQLAAKHGNGDITLTQRGNLQLRGVGEASLSALNKSLGDLGLLDETPEAEAVRNVAVSPLAGLDPECIEGREIARRIEDRLQRDSALNALPAKFAFAIDGGGLWPLGDTGADIVLSAEVTEEQWRLRIAGSDLASVPLPGEHAAEAALQLALRFAATGLPRMRDWVGQDTARAIYATAAITEDATQRPQRTKPRSAAAGCLKLSPKRVIAAIGLPFGQVSAQQLTRLADACGLLTILRLTPWRLVLVPTGDAIAAAQILDRARMFGFITTPDDPRTLVQACIGAPGCQNATTPTRVDASLLAKLAAGSGPMRLHVSGCAKGCAFRGPAPVTLVGRDGRYDLVLNGRASDSPARTGIARAELSVTLQQLDAWR